MRKNMKDDEDLSMLSAGYIYYLTLTKEKLKLKKQFFISANYAKKECQLLLIKIVVINLVD